jgi:hypothetical protein
VTADNFKLLRFDSWRFENKLVLDIEDFLTTDTDDMMMRPGIRVEPFLKGIEVEFHDLPMPS